MDISNKNKEINSVSAYSGKQATPVFHYDDVIFLLPIYIQDSGLFSVMKETIFRNISYSDVREIRADLWKQLLSNKKDFTWPQR